MNIQKAFSRTILILLCMAFSAYPAFSAEEEEIDTSINAHRARKDELYLSRDDQPPPKATYYPKVKYERIIPPETLSQEVTTILYGVYTDIPPQYDHYGYEIRRYMSHVTEPAVYRDLDRIKEELLNIEKAMIIAQYWRKEKADQIEEIEKKLDAEANIENSVRRNFSYNQSVVDTFFVSLSQWMMANKDLLLVLKENFGDYGFEYPRLVFDEKKVQNKFRDILKEREKALKSIKEYTPFAMMVY